MGKPKKRITADTIRAALEGLGGRGTCTELMDLLDLQTRQSFWQHITRASKHLNLSRAYDEAKKKIVLVLN